MTINTANEHDIPAIIQLAEVTWNETYRHIISEEQIQYMLQLFYRTNTVFQQILTRGHHF